MRPAWGSYPETILHFPEAGLAVDLRRPVTAPALQALARLGLAGPFATVTAENPLGGRLAEPVNRRLSTVLAAVVRERHPGSRVVNGESPDGRHLERGWAIPEPLLECRTLAAQFFQNALFWFDGARFWIVPVLASGPSLQLPIESPAR